MREERGHRFYSASDLVNYLGCAHATFCDVRQLTQPVELLEDNEHAALLQEKGFEHERAYLERLRKDGRSIAEIPSEGSLDARVNATRKAMQGGADVVYQGALVTAPWHGFSDFLLRVNGVPSSLGRLVLTARPCPTPSACASRYNNGNIVSEPVANAARRRSGHDLNSRAGSSRSGAQHTDSARVISGRSGDRESPSPGLAV
jgi:hypothetical protein